ncbi:MAG: DAK2 domain-containing protein [Lachnospiraceae bacterium]|nr:DAK2 domain-containing protein [Lachnospiraceae bacterium]MDY5741522.1 DAK2 domain-containing protein [Lachnospiraceae bacterium]
MFLAGAKNIEVKKEWINELNVFPVPDGDTGTNMTMTIMAAAAEVAAVTEISMQAVCKAISSGALRGARGNSGVILSQLLRGFTKIVKTHDEVTVPVLAEAFDKAVETAYKSVMKPKEGTILTVARRAAEEAAVLALQEDIKMEDFLRAVIAKAEDTLSKTPEMLPVLKEAGVVDSGGQGLLEILKGAFDGFLGKEIALDFVAPAAVVQAAVGTDMPEADIKFGYCTEFIIDLAGEATEEMEDQLKNYLSSIGDSLVVVADENVIKIHVHTNDPGQALSKALTYGSLSKIKIDNMRLEHQEKLIKDSLKMAARQEAERMAKKPTKENGFICVSSGDGMADMLNSLGADYIIRGGQTMNPSTDDMLKAIDQVPAHNIYIFPNNKNIILAANQAKAMTKDKNIIVIPSTTVPQCISALIGYMDGAPVEENTESFMEAISLVATGQVTYAVRDTKIDDKEIHQGDFMGLGDHGLLSVGTELFDTAMETAKLMLEDDREVFSIFYGEGVTEEDAGVLAAHITEAYPGVEVECHFGGQPVYYYVFSAE